MQNLTILEGRMVYTPTMRRTQSGTPVTSGRIANQFDDGGTLFLNFVAWREWAMKAAEAKKGQLVTITGHLKPNTWKDKDGTVKTDIELEVESFSISPIMPKKKPVVDGMKYAPKIDPDYSIEEE